MAVDKISLQRIERLHPKIRQKVKDAYLLACERLTGKAILRLAYTERTDAEQDGLYAQGRTKLFDASGKRLGKVTNAKGCQSIHNYNLAWDIVLLIDKDGNGTFEAASWDMNTDFDGDKVPDWAEVVCIFKGIGASWGGDWASFKDYPHFQIEFGYSWQELQALKKAGKVDKEGFVLLERC
jgi:peptidoglycan L-alanyl-D-glutamate endopeptidase CwlK